MGKNVHITAIPEFINKLPANPLHAAGVIEDGTFGRVRM
jgi:hypothetical protein